MLDKEKIPDYINMARILIAGSYIEEKRETIGEERYFTEEEVVNYLNNNWTEDDEENAQGLALELALDPKLQ